MKKKIKLHLENNFKDAIEILRNYYRSDIAVANVHLKRNYGLKDQLITIANKERKNLSFTIIIFIVIIIL